MAIWEYYKHTRGWGALRGSSVETRMDDLHLKALPAGGPGRREPPPLGHSRRRVVGCSWSHPREATTDRCRLINEGKTSEIESEFFIFRACTR